jgi:hypothetical protein
MTSSGRSRGSTYAESTKLQIVRAVLRQPGRTGRQIAESLGLDRSRVNSFLYGEGKRRFGLSNSSWRWYPGREAVQRFTYEQPTNTRERIAKRSDAALTDTVCGILSKMSVTTATLKIRGMSLTLIELAFSEDEYPALDEQLQAELIMRKKTLEAASKEVQIVKQAPSRWFWVLVIVLGTWVLTLLGNQKSGNYQPTQQQNGVQQTLPR